MAAFAGVAAMFGADMLERIERLQEVRRHAHLQQWYGQSTSIGAGSTGTLSGRTAFPNVWMPNHGVQDASWAGGNLVGLTSLSNGLAPLDGTVNSQGVEAPVVSACNQLASMLPDVMIIGANAGRGSFGMQGLEKGYSDGGGPGPYGLLVDQRQRYPLWTGGKPVRSSLNLMHGQADANLFPISTIANNKINYKLGGRGVQRNLAIDTGQDNIHLFVSQFSSHTMRAPACNYHIALAQAELGEEYADVSVIGPEYFVDYVDGVHPANTGQRLIGAGFGKAQFHQLMTGRKFVPLRPARVQRDGRFVAIDYEGAVGNLRFDTDRVADPGYMGFEVFLQGSDAALPLAGGRPRLYGKSTVVLEMASDPAAPVDFGYGIGSTLNGQPAGRLTGARGCLRDEDDTRAWFDPDLRLPNWALHSRKPQGYVVPGYAG
jgi:hypothetical protein